jgi:hypothetical protein
MLVPVSVQILPSFLTMDWNNKRRDFTHTCCAADLASSSFSAALVKVFRTEQVDHLHLLAQG